MMSSLGNESSATVSTSFLNRFSSTFKFLLIGFLILILLAPLGLVSGVINERQYRSQDVQKEITANWGARQGVVGPLLVIPYEVLTEERREDNDKHSKTKLLKEVHYAHFLPEHLDVKATLQPDVRYRGIYQTVVYTSVITLSGAFSPVTMAAMKELRKDIQPKDIQWERTLFSVPVNDLKGIQPNSTLQLNEKKLVFEPGKQFRGLQVGFKDLQTVSDNNKPIPFKITLALNGSQEFSMAPTGKETSVNITSPWKNPSFTGAYLPTQRQVNEKGFSSTWKTSYFARSYPQVWSAASITDPVLISSNNTGNGLENAQIENSQQQDFLTAMEHSAFGVSLIQPVDFYQQSERSVKYGVLFLTLTFLTFFLFEVVSNVRIHGIQYILVGLALCLFYLLLLSFAEVIGFLGAYCIASVSTVGLISFYAQGFLKSKKHVWVMPSLLLALYSYLYILLQLEDLSLLFGTIGLFVALTVVMTVTRKVDWFKRDS
jgi:inner membrane protein